MIPALTPGLIALGLCVAILPWLRHENPAARSLMVVFALLLMVRYFGWRIAATVPPVGWTADFAVGSVFLFAEAASLAAGALSLVFLSRTIDRTPQVEANRQWLAGRHAPLIDVFICTYNEEVSILERTIIGATGMKYPNYRVWVLDDGRRDWLEKLAGELGCRYLARPDNKGAKAGNINHALRHVTGLADPPEFISVLDADFVPMPEFLARAMCLFRDPGVAVVQTPQHFINADPIQTNLAATKVWPDEQRFFFDIMMPAKDAWGAAFCCGTSSVIRLSSLVNIGGFPTDSVTEDYLLTLRLKEIGARTVYLNERLTLGLAPEGLKEYITQRSRWCLGFMQICRGRSGPFSRTSRLGVVDRLSLVEAFLSWTSTYVVKVFGLVVPSLYLLFGIKAVQADLSELLGYFLPFYVWYSLTMAWISRGRSMAVMSDVAQYIALPTVLKAAVTGLLRPQGHKFEVTAKGGDRDQSFIEWPLLRVYGTALSITLAGIVYAFLLHVQGESIAYGGLALAWSLYNAIILTIVCLVSIEQPRRRKAERFERDEPVFFNIGGRQCIYRLADMSITGARFVSDRPPPVGTAVHCTLQERKVAALVVRRTGDGFAIRFDETLNTRVDLVRAFYSGDYVSAFTGIRAAPVGKAIMMRIFG
ncbi:glycosyltransferase [Bradyrhizobium betae]|uniref:Glycosyl transferase family 2 n=1 Tax=Bradyrhizobium betae TaxID=244734 RepID=A0A4Q1UFY1_9BRAD|nr:glycosyltransferase [Bradyrhizobium betae]RXT33568.1 glycosyl transferase family 2 [Bradyrhizobium betae]